MNGFLPIVLHQDRNKTFILEYLLRSHFDNAVVYEVGGGSRPAISNEIKRMHSLTVVGLDISGEELAKAPDGAYDRTITADLYAYAG